MPNNRGLRDAKVAKNDEFYTRTEDIEEEILTHLDYLKFFEGKIVYCNCDNPETSGFYRFFCKHFQKLKIKKFIVTHLNPSGGRSYKLKWDGKRNDDGMPTMLKTELEGNGDFRSDECVELLKEADLIVTNPPFSIFGEYVEQLMKYRKNFLIIGNKNAITRKDIFPLMKEEKMWFGYNRVKEFIQTDGSMAKFGNVGWYTNLGIERQHVPLMLTKHYYGHEDDYPMYVNYNAINVDRRTDIPDDYYGIMGVPITYMEIHCSEQFEIIGSDMNCYVEQLGIQPIGDEWADLYHAQGGTTHLTASMHNLVYIKDGVAKQPYKRVLIRKKIDKDYKAGKENVQFCR